MATTLYLTPSLSGLGTGKLALLPWRGLASTTAITNTTASGTNITVTQTAGGTALSWWIQVDAVTISGNVSANIRGLESSTSANAGAGILIEWYDSVGTTLKGTILSDRTVPSTITEYSTSDAAKALAAVAPTSSALLAGDWIKVTLKVRNVGTMGGSFTVTNSYGGPTAAAAGDTSVTFTEAIKPYSGGTNPNCLAVYQLHDASALTTRGYTVNAITAGQGRVLTVTSYAGSASITSVTGGGCTWQQCGGGHNDSGPDDSTLQIWEGVYDGSGNDTTVTVNSASFTLTGFLADFSNMGTSASTVTTAGADSAGANTANPSPGALTGGGSTKLAVMTMADIDGTTPTGVSTNWVPFGPPSNNSHWAAFRINPASESPTFTHVSVQWNAYATVLTPVSGAASGTGSLTLSGSASGAASASAAGSLSLSGSGVQSDVATGVLTLSASAVQSSKATGSLALSATVTQSSVATGSVTLSGSGSSKANAVGTATLTLTGSATQSTTAAAALSLTGSAAQSTAATGSLALSGSAIQSSVATGAITLAASATPSLKATGSLALSGSATQSTAATGSLALTGTTSASSVPSGAITLSATARPSAAATGGLTLQGSAAPSTTATAAFTLTGSATTGGTGSTGTANLTLTAAATGQAAASSTAALTLTGSATPQASVSGTASLALTGTAPAAGQVAGSGLITLAGNGGAAGQISGFAALTLQGIGALQAQAASQAFLTLTALGAGRDEHTTTPAHGTVTVNTATDTVVTLEAQTASAVALAGLVTASVLTSGTAGTVTLRTQVAGQVTASTA